MDETSLPRSPQANDFVHRAQGLEQGQRFLRQEPGPRGAMSENRLYAIYALDAHLRGIDAVPPQHREHALPRGGRLGEGDHRLPTKYCLRKAGCGARLSRKKPLRLHTSAK